MRKQHKNRHKLLLISSTKYEILLASWPLTVALIVCRSHVIKRAGFILFLLDEMSWPSKWEILCTLLLDT